MSYLPTQDKMHQVGFTPGQMLSNGNQTYYGPDERWIVVRHQSKKVSFRDDVVKVVLDLPNEDYFDLTLLALGWK